MRNRRSPKYSRMSEPTVKERNGDRNAPDFSRFTDFTHASFLSQKTGGPKENSAAASWSNTTKCFISLRSPQNMKMESFVDAGMDCRHLGWQDTSGDIHVSLD